MRRDPHSYTDDAQPKTRHVSLHLVVDFDAHCVRGTAEYELERAADGWVDFDTRDLSIEGVTAGASAAPFQIDAAETFMGSRLRVQAAGADRISIRFRGSPGASALQWLTKEMTAGGRQPFMFTQCQAIHARSIFPCQDSPSVRVTYSAKLDVPEGLVAVMAAKSLGSVPAELGRATFSFEMRQPIPTYLFAFAVGPLASKDVGPRSCVYAEPELLESAAFEFAHVESMIERAESLFGPYVWERFDMLVMPPSFPYGGMENPRLTFLTPTLLSGDRSLVNVVAHELAHSWTGNLVTNASMNDFWLNEGFTTYAERRILEALEGADRATQHAALGLEALRRELGRFPEGSPLTHLEVELTGVDPDEVYSSIPYEKGYLFLRRIEAHVGRPRFDAFLLAYIARFPFQSITTRDFVEFLSKELPGVGAEIKMDAWLHGPGIPADAPLPKSPELDRLRGIAAELAANGNSDAAADLTPTDLQVVVSALPKSLDAAIADAIDDRLHLIDSGNAEIRIPWLAVLARSNNPRGDARIRQDLLVIGRMKYLRPLYGALVDAGRQTLAREIFGAAKDRYHPVARGLVERLISQ